MAVTENASTTEGGEVAPQNGMRIHVAITTEDEKTGETKTYESDVVLNVAEQRLLVEREAKEPCFRMWLWNNEYEKGKFADWTVYPLADGKRMAIWRKESDMVVLRTAGNQSVIKMIEQRRLHDHEE